MLLLVIGFFPPLTLHIADIQHCIPRMFSHPSTKQEPSLSTHVTWNECDITNLEKAFLGLRIVLS